jgi:hypothetical protein
MTAPKPPFVLTREDRLNPLWRKLMAHMSDELAALRQANDADRDPIETARLRGKIAAYKSLLALNNEPDPNAQAVPVTHQF